MAGDARREGAAVIGTVGLDWQRLPRLVRPTDAARPAWSAHASYVPICIPPGGSARRGSGRTLWPVLKKELRDGSAGGPLARSGADLQPMTEARNADSGTTLVAAAVTGSVILGDAESLEAT